MRWIVIKRNWIWVGAGVCACLAWGVMVHAQESSVTQARSTLERWIETQQTIAKQKQDWAVGKEMLTERISLLQNEIESLKTKISEAEKSIGEADKKRAGLLEENESLKSLGKVLADTVTEFEARTRVLNQRLPEPIADLVKPLSQRLPDDPNATKLSLGIRFQNVIGVLDAVNKFNREIKVVPEVRELPGGQTAEVTALYVGLGQAYYVGSNGLIAGVGHPTEDGWQWEAANDIAGQVQDVVSIMKNEKVASFVMLPAKVQ